MEVNSCLTILSSDVFSRELEKQTTRGMQAEDYVAVATVPTCTSISLKGKGSSTVPQSYAMTCCCNIFWNILGESVSFACARLCSFLLFISIWWIFLYPHSVLAGWNTRVAPPRKRNNKNSREKCVYFDSHVSFFMSCSPWICKWLCILQI